MDINTLAKQITEKFKGFKDFKGLYFYGSRVKGGFKEDSDYDVIMLFLNSVNYKTNKEIAGHLGDIEYENDVFIDYHPMTREELIENPIFYNEVMNKGLYFEGT